MYDENFYPIHHLKMEDHLTIKCKFLNMFCVNIFLNVEDCEAE